MRKTLMLSTCGTSLLANLADDRRLVLRHANASAEGEVPPQDRSTLQRLLARAQRTILEAAPEQQRRLSAELSGILGYYSGRPTPVSGAHWLIATDTWLGFACAEIVAQVLQKTGHVASARRIRDLRTNSLEEFRCAMPELVKLCDQEVEAYRRNRYQVIFNLTGGFKVVQGFMQALAMRYADLSIYVFEGTDQLLQVPRLPPDLDHQVILRNHQRVFRRLAVGLPISQKEVHSLPETLLLEVNGQFALSVWGDVIWEQGKHTLLSERLWEPLDAKLRFGPHFQTSVSGLPKDLLVIVNERLAQLARHLHDSSYNPKSLDFKKLAHRVGSRTHECDAWSDRGAKRLFGHFEKGVFVVEALDEGLH
jgi:putative CRISPR-associated protein (TIGR02619 family)